MNIPENSIKEDELDFLKTYKRDLVIKSSTILDHLAVHCQNPNVKSNFLSERGITAGMSIHKVNKTERERDWDYLCTSGYRWPNRAINLKNRKRFKLVCLLEGRWWWWCWLSSSEAQQSLKLGRKMPVLRSDWPKGKAEEEGNEWERERERPGRLNPWRRRRGFAEEVRQTWEIACLFFGSSSTYAYDIYIHVKWENSN